MAFARPNLPCLLVLYSLVFPGSHPMALGAESIPEDTCFIQLDLPAGATASLDGNDYGQQRVLKYDGLTPGMTYSAKVEVRMADGSRVRRDLLFGGGRRVVLPIQPPDAKRPQLVLQGGHAGERGATCAAFSVDRRFLLTGGVDHTAVLWEVGSGRALRTYTCQKGLFSVAFLPGGEQLLTADYGGVSVWDRDTGRILRTIPSDEYSFFSAALSTDGQTLLTGGSSEVILWDLTGRRLRTLPRESRGTVLGVAFSADGRLGLAWSSRELVAWDLTSGSRLRAFNGSRTEIAFASFTPDGRRIVAATSGWNYPNPTETTCEILLWDVDRSEPVRQMRQPWAFGKGCITPDGRRVLAEVKRNLPSGDIEYKTARWPTEAPEAFEVLPWQRQGRLSVFSHDGELYFDGHAIRDLQRGEVLRAGGRMGLGLVCRVPGRRAGAGRPPLMTKLFLGEEQLVGFSGQGTSFPILPAGGK